MKWRANCCGESFRRISAAVISASFGMSETSSIEIRRKTQAQLEEELLDIKKLHEWESTTALGAHENRPLPPGGDNDDSRVVLVVRGDLLKKYPTVVIYAQEAKWDLDEGGCSRVG